MAIKPKHNISPWLFMLIAIFSVAMSQGQEKDPEEPKGRPVKILYFQAPTDAPSEAYIYSAGKQIVRTELPRSNFSETFWIPKGALPLRFFPEPRGDDKPPATKPPVARIPASWKKILLLVFEDKANKVMPIRVLAIDASDNKFGPGSIYMLNFSDLAIFGTVGDKTLRLKPKSTQIFKNPINTNGFYPVKLQAVIRGDKKPRRFIKQMWRNNDQVRNVLFIMPKPAPHYGTYYSAPIQGF